MTSIMLVLFCGIAHGASFYAVESGNWFTPQTWGLAFGFPGADDDVFINSGIVVDLNGATQISVRSLGIGTTSGPGTIARLNGNDWGNCHIIIRDGISFGGAASLNLLIPGYGGSLTVQLGGHFTAFGAFIYHVGTTTLTADSPLLFDNSVQLTIDSGNPYDLQTSFVSTNPYGNYELVTPVTFPSLGTFGFNNMYLDLWNYASITNAVLQGCHVHHRNQFTINRLYQCHLYSTSFDATTRISSPVALMDNNNSFQDLIIENGGSLWGNYGVPGSTSISGDLTMTGQASLSPGDYGTLDIYLGGDLRIDNAMNAVYAAGNTYFTGGRPPEDPQVIYAEGYTFQGNFNNLNSALRLDSSVRFSNLNAYAFYPGNIDVQSFAIVNAQLNYGVLTGSADNPMQINGCYLTSCVFSQKVRLIDCTVADNFNLFYQETRVQGSLRGDYGEANEIVFLGRLIVLPDATVSPGDYGELNLKLYGGIINHSTVTAYTVFEASAESVLTFGVNSVFHNIQNNSPVLVLDPMTMPQPWLLMNNYTINSAPGCSLLLRNGILINSANLSNCTFAVEDQACDLILEQVGLTNCTFNLPVYLNSNAILDDSNTSFNNGLNIIAGTLTGTYGAHCSFNVSNLQTTGGNIVPGDYGTLDVRLTGDLYILNTAPTAALSASSVSFCGSGGQSVYIPYSICNANLNMNGGQALNFMSGVTFEPSGLKAINSYGAGVNQFNLNGYQLSNANLGGGTYSNGTLRDCSLYYNNCSEITIAGVCTLGNNEVVFTTPATITGALRGNSNYDSEVLFQSDLNLDGSLVPGDFGSLTVYAQGNITKASGAVLQGELLLAGSGQRTLVLPFLSSQMPFVDIRTDENAHVELIGQNSMPEFEVASTSTFIVSPGAVLTINISGMYYSGNLVMRGALINYTHLSDSHHVYHNLDLTLFETYTYAELLKGTHSMVDIANLENDTQEVWGVQTLYPVAPMYGNLVFDYNQARPANLRLFLSFDEGSSWEMFGGSQIQNEADGTFQASNVPLNAFYALATPANTWGDDDLLAPVSGPTILRPLFSWNPIGGGVAYSVAISTEPDFSSLYTMSPAVPDTSFQFDFAFPPDTQYWWKVNATSTIYGDVSSLAASFSTRGAMGCSLPGNADYNPGDTMSFYLPAFIQNLLAGETFEVSLFGSENLQLAYETEVLTITATPGWTGQEEIGINLFDGYTLLSPHILVTVLGTPQNLTCRREFDAGTEYDVIGFDAVPGATFYLLYVSETPDGPWTANVWAVANEIWNPFPGDVKFYKVTAHTGSLPGFGPGRN